MAVPADDPVPSLSPAGRTSARRGLAPCIAAICLYWLSLYLYVPLLAPQAHRLGAGVGGVGLVLAAYGLVQFALRIPTGLWSDRMGRRLPVMAVALVASGVAALGMGVARTPAMLGLFRGVSGLGACGWVAVTLLFAEFFPVERTAWAMGILGFLSTCSQLVGMFLGGLLAQVSGGYIASFFGAAVLAVAGVLVAMAVREPAPAEGRLAVSLRSRLAVGLEAQVLVASGLAVCSQYLQFATNYGFVPLVATTRFGASGAALGLLSLFGGVPAALSALASGWLGRRWSGRVVALTGFALAATGAALLPAAPTLQWLYGAAAVIGLGLGLIGPTLMASAVRGFGPERRGTAMGFYQSIYAIGMFSGPALAGRIGHVLGMGGLFDTTAAVGAAGAVLCVFLLGRRWTATAAGRAGEVEASA